MRPGRKPGQVGTYCSWAARTRAERITQNIYLAGIDSPFISDDVAAAFGLKALAAIKRKDTFGTIYTLVYIAAHFGNSSLGHAFNYR